MHCQANDFPMGPVAIGGFWTRHIAWARRSAGSARMELSSSATGSDASQLENHAEPVANGLTLDDLAIHTRK